MDLDELKLSGEGERGAKEWPNRRAWRLSISLSETLPPLEEVQENPRLFGLPDVPDENPKAPGTYLDRIRVEEESDISYLIWGLYSRNGYYSFGGAAEPDPVGMGLWDYRSMYRTKKVPISQLRLLYLAVPFFPLPTMYRWDPVEGEAGFTLAQVLHNLTLRRGEVNASPDELLSIARQSQKVHHLRLSGYEGYYLFSGTWRQVGPGLYDIEYTWMSDPGIKDLGLHATDFENTAWPGKSPDHRIPVPGDPGGDVWAVPPFFDVSKAPSMMTTDPEKELPRFPLFTGYEFDLFGWQTLPPIWLS